MKPTTVASREEWLAARLELLKKEKEHSRARDELTRERQESNKGKVVERHFAAGHELDRIMAGDPTCKHYG